MLLAVNEKVHATLDRTQKLPFSVRYEATHVAGVAEVLQIDAGTVVRPRAELERTELVVERKPRDVDLARAHEKSGRDPQAVAGRVDHHVGRERAVNVFVGANGTKTTRCPCTHCSHIIREVIPLNDYEIWPQETKNMALSYGAKSVSIC